MNKEFKALEKIANLPMTEQYKSDYKGGMTNCIVADNCGKEIKIIETALKRLEEIDNKPKVILGRTHGQTKSMIDYVCQNWKEVKITNLDDEKKLKAFEIIKKKNITPYEDVLQNGGYEDYLMFRNLCKQDLEENEILASKLLTKEEYELLKEVLLCR